jgi:outer membrane protein assembly factor BamE (lipoprotein component of BamABCDE complex)
MFFFFKNHLILFTFIFLILTGCQFNEPLKNHGIVYLENRAKKLFINKTNKNDIISIIGQPHIKSGEKEDSWIYVERILTKGKYHKLGQHVLKANNVLILDFNKYGILIGKKLLDKNEINNIKFSKKETENELAQKSFIENFLQSIKQKMYSNRK